MFFSDSPGAGPRGGIEGAWSRATKLVSLFNTRVSHQEALCPQVISNTNFVDCSIQNYGS